MFMKKGQFRKGPNQKMTKIMFSMSKVLLLLIHIGHITYKYTRFNMLFAFHFNVNVGCLSTLMT